MIELFKKLDDSKLFKAALYLSCFIYLSGLIIGFMEFSNEMKIPFKKIEIDLNKSLWKYFFEISINNLALVSLIILGVLSISVTSITLLFINGYVFGRLISFTIERDYIFFRNSLPHSLEIFGIIVSGSLCFYLICKSYQNLYINTFSVFATTKKLVSDPIVIKAISFTYLSTILSAFIEVFISFNL